MSDELTRSKLKNQALLEKVSSLVTRYENEVAELRVDLTVSLAEKDAEIQRLNNRITELETPDVSEEEG